MDLLQTPLHEIALETGARMVPFAGWEMPVQFTGVVEEHSSVRKKAGVFDISHMGVFRLEGKNPKDALQALVPTDLHRIGPGEACYSVLLNENGGIIDDLIIYDLGTSSETSSSLLIVINASRTETDIKWLRTYLDPSEISILDAKKNKIFLAVQGPQAQQILESIIGISLERMPRFSHCYINLKNFNQSNTAFIARTGYTGEEGFEILLQSDLGHSLWQELLAKGVTPCGLGARDTLRIEAGMHLYGNDMDQTTTPFEAGLGWLVHLEKAMPFIGQEALAKQAEFGIKQRLIGLELTERAIARSGYKVLHQGKVIGKITSGTWSPTLGKAIAMAYVPTSLSKIGQLLEVEIRNKRHIAKVVKKTFYLRSSA